jgi:hypothetical protein
MRVDASVPLDLPREPIPRLPGQFIGPPLFSKTSVSVGQRLGPVGRPLTLPRQLNVGIGALSAMSTSQSPRDSSRHRGPVLLTRHDHSGLDDPPIPTRHMAQLTQCDDKAHPAQVPQLPPVPALTC